MTSSGSRRTGTMGDGDWNSGFARSVMVFLNGDAIPEPDRWAAISDDHFLLLFNAHSEPISFTLPRKAFGSNWLSGWTPTVVRSTRVT